MTWVLESSAVVSVDAGEGTLIVSESTVVCGDVLVSRGSRPGDDVDCVSDSVVSERPASGVGTEASPLSEEGTTAVVPLGVSDPAGAEDWDSCVDVMVPKLVTAVFPERWSPSVAGDASENTRLSPEVLLTPEGGLVTGARLVLNAPLVPSPAGVLGEVAGTGAVGSLACDVGECREGDVAACEGTRADGDVVSWSEAGLVRDTTSEPVSTPMVTTELAETRVPAE